MAHAPESLSKPVAPTETFHAAAVPCSRRTCMARCRQTTVLAGQLLLGRSSAWRSLVSHVRHYFLPRDRVCFIMNLGVNRRLRAVISGKLRKFLARRPERETATGPAGPIEFLEERKDARIPTLSGWLFRGVKPDQVVVRRRQNFAALLDAVMECTRIRPLIPRLVDGASPGFFPVIVAGDSARFIEFCRARGVRAHLLWPRLHPAFPAEQFPETVWMKKQVVVLPAHQDLREGDLALLQELIAAWQQAIT